MWLLLQWKFQVEPPRPNQESFKMQCMVASGLQLPLYQRNMGLYAECAIYHRVLYRECAVYHRVLCGECAIYHRLLFWVRAICHRLFLYLGIYKLSKVLCSLDVTLWQHCFSNNKFQTCTFLGKAKHALFM